MSVLILSAPQNLHAAAVAERLTALGAAYHFFRFDQLLDGTTLQVSIGGSRDAALLTTADGRRIDLREVTAVWFRRPGTVRFSGLPEPWMDQVVSNEATQVLWGLLRSLNCLFVNHPGHDREASFKLWQLEVARRVGLAVPATIVTNVPEEVAAFYERCGGEVIYKFASESTNWMFPKYETLGVPTLTLSAADLDHLDQVAIGPHLFQERISKSYEIRVTSIGRKLFPVKIDSQAGQGAVDWRLDYSVSMELIELPPEIHGACLALLEQLGLNYAAIDLAVTPDGEHVFFEVNPAGQYLWMEQRIEELDLSRELACLLVGQGEPVVPPDRVESVS